MPHFCWDEVQAILLGLPFVGFAWGWARAKVSRKSACSRPDSAAASDAES
jgi:hypothetical protein